MTNEEIYLLKIAEFDLARHSLSLAFESLYDSARPAGKSGVQVLVLADKLTEAALRLGFLNAVRWPVSSQPETDKHLIDDTDKFDDSIMCVKATIEQWRAIYGLALQIESPIVPYLFDSERMAKSVIEDQMNRARQIINAIPQAAKQNFPI